MSTYSQDKRPIRVKTALGKDELMLSGFTGTEKMSQPFSYTLDLVSENAAVDPASVLRKPATIEIELPNDGGTRFINGIVNRFSQLGQVEDLTTYRAEIVPWLWFLSLSSDCKIYQNLSVTEIVQQVFKDDLGYSDFDIRCAGSYPKREYCVQYRETHLAFVSRLLEEEGIFYFFEHGDGKHTLVLADQPSAVQPCPGMSSARMASHGEAQPDDVITRLVQEHAVESGKVTLRDYDPLQPSLRLEGTVSGKEKEELYDYPGDFTKMDEGQRYARVRLEAHEAQQQVVRGAGTCRAMQSGYRFDLKDHYRKEINQSYQIVSVHHQAHAGDYRSWDTAPLDYDNEFVCIPHSVPYRPPRRTPRPRVGGHQTAVVVGKAGEEIWVDKNGRIKVQFHWDRKGKKDENSSCWVRVGTAWAGKGWGAIHIPRIGQEVLVEFLDGDPQYPVVIGSVWNGEQTPPYTLPDNGTQSGVKSRSSKGGGTDTFNEIRLEDKKDKEEIFVQAQKDLTVSVKNDEKRTVLHDRTTEIKNNETRTVKEGDDTTTIEKGKQTITVKQGDQATSIDQGDQTVTIKMGKQVVTLSNGDQQVNLKMGNQSTKADMGNITVKAALGKVSMEAMQGLELKVGQSSIKLDQTGVTIKGMMLKLEGQIQTELKGTMTTVQGNAMLTVKGGIAMIN
jgi:type VI secretion system secreted protein VgrG